MKFQELKELTENLVKIDTTLFEGAKNKNIYGEAWLAKYFTRLKSRGDAENHLPLFKKRETILKKLKTVTKGDDISRLYRCKVSVLKKHLAKSNSNEELSLFTIYNNDPYDWEDDPSVSVYFAKGGRPFTVLHRAAMQGESIEENRQNILLTLTPLFNAYPYTHNWQELLKECPTLREELWGALRDQYNEIVSAKLEENRSALQANERRLIELTNPLFLQKKIEELKRKEVSISKKIKEDKEKFDEIDLNIFEN